MIKIYNIIFVLLITSNLYAQKNKDYISEHRPKYESDYDFKLNDIIENDSISFYETINDSIEFYTDSVKTIYERGVAKRAFVVLVYNGTDRDKALEIRSKVLRYFPDSDLKLDYKAPSWKLKVGPFLERLGAVRIKEGLKQKGITNVLIVPDVITYGTK